MEPPTDLGRRERRKLETRARIVGAAAELFIERGFATTKVADICDRVDIVQKTFFNYFPTKQHLLREIAQEALGELCTQIETARKEEDSTGRRLLHFFQDTAERAEQAGPMNRELLSELVHVVNESSEKSTHARKLHDAFGEIVHDGLEAGEVTRRHSPETLTEMILGAYYVLMFNYANLDGYSIQRHAKAVARFLGDALAPLAEE